MESTVFQFQPYDPARPRMVTSFKGNQKLIFEGYRYNIHHIVPTKGVKTWRCVCAKKLTSARSWCKGRAETWDNDSHGISKGEHNHPAEHEVAELEYFKSQLILAAIASPAVMLNELIDEAATFMSDGVSFGSRESLKKSLTVARKSAENGGFKLKCYKNSDPAGAAAATKAQKQQAKINGSDLFPADLKLFDGNGTMLSLLSLARQCQGQDSQQSSGQENGASAAAAAAAALFLNSTSNTSDNDSSLNLLDNNEQSTSSSNCSSSSILNQHFAPNILTTANNTQAADGSNASDASSTDFLLDGSGLDLMIDVVGSPPPSKMARHEIAGCGSSSSAASTPARDGASHNDSGCFSGTSSLNNGRRQNAASASSDLASAVNSMLAANSTPLTSSGSNAQQQHRSNFMQLQKKTARINNIFNKLSHKAAAAACSTPPPSSVSQTPPSLAMSMATPNLINTFSANSRQSLHQQFQIPFANLLQQQQHLNQRQNMTVREGLKSLHKRAHFNASNGGYHPKAATKRQPLHKAMCASVETQTEPVEGNGSRNGTKVEPTEEDSKCFQEIRPTSCLGASSNCAGASLTATSSSSSASNQPQCGCRIIKVCCCSEETCTRRRPSLASSSSLASTEK